MKANSKTQSDQGLKFSGAEVMSQDRSNKFRGNQHGGAAEGNFGRGPTKGNSDGKQAGPSTASGTAQKRNPGGTRAWDPKAGQNYNGNPDKINAGAGPRKGNQK